MAPEIVLVGLGPGDLRLLTREAEDTLLGADRILLRLSVDPVFWWLEERGKDVLCLDFLYTIPRIHYAQVYDLIADIVIREARSHGRAVYAVPGHPFVFEIPSSLISERARAEGMSLRVVPGLSFVEHVYATLRLDPVAGIQVCNSCNFLTADPAFTNQFAILIGQMFTRPAPGLPRELRYYTNVNEWLRAQFPPDHPVTLVWTSLRPDFETRTAAFPLAELVARCSELKGQATLYVPAIGNGVSRPW